MPTRRSQASQVLAAALVLAACAGLAQLAVAQSQPPPAEAAAGFVLGLPEGAALEGEALDEATQEVARDIRCPVCQGLSIADSPVDTAIAMRTEVREMLAEGYSASQILAYFEASYGEFIRLEPKAEGFNLVVWIAPVIGLLVGFGIVVHRLRQGSAQRSASFAEETTVNEDEGPTEDNDELADYLAQVRREVGS